uniref:Uncharacterized protein n=1 Tax=Anguilla anguilla TaxID=7936 RepID=A0A0E9Q8U1_ANGAN
MPPLTTCLSTVLRSQQYLLDLEFLL